MKNFCYNRNKWKRKQVFIIILLTLDLSTKSSGYCIGENEKIKTHGCITATSRDVVKRIIKMRDQIKLLIENNKIDKIVMQEVRLQRNNNHTTKVLMWLQAAIVIASYELNPKIELEFVGASTWRSALKMRQGPGIKRTSAKQQDIQYVKNKYNIKVNDDQADAICIFDAYYQQNDNEINWE